MQHPDCTLPRGKYILTDPLMMCSPHHVSRQPPISSRAVLPINTVDLKRQPPYIRGVNVLLLAIFVLLMRNDSLSNPVVGPRL